MSSGYESHLRERLNTALDGLAPAPLPFDTVVRRGQRMAWRRRVATVSAAIVAAGVVAAVPVMLRGISAGPVAGPGYHVTVHRPGPGSPSTQVAEGTVDGHRWRIAVTRREYQICSGPVGHSTCSGGSPVSVAEPTAPAAAGLVIGTRPQADILRVRADVTYLRVSLTNGQNLTLWPVRALGPGHPSYAAFAIPAASDVIRIAAFAARGQIAYAVPFTALGDIELGRWLPPGAPAAPAPATYRLGTGVTGGRRWVQRLYVGPWGLCTGGTAQLGTFCFTADTNALTGGSAARWLDTSYIGSGPGVAVIVATRRVAYLTVSTGPQRSRIAAVPAAGGKFFAVPVPATGRTRWVARSASGAALASGVIG
jgi:hypothetical protein